MRQISPMRKGTVKKTVKLFGRSAEFQKFQVLKTNRNKRHKYGEFFVEGVRNINGAVEGGWKISSFLYSREKPLSRWAEELLATVPTEKNYQLTPELMGELSGKTDTSELMAVVRMRPDDLSLLPLSENPCLVLFDRASNRGNLGTILRSCDALGADGLILTGHAVDLYDPEVIVSSMGSFFRVPAVRAEDNDTVFRYIESLRKRYPGFQVLGTTAHKQYPLYREDLTGPLMLMVGNETQGLCYAFKEGCDKLVTIPMAETSYASSFNVACAATVMLYEVSRQRAMQEL